MSTLYWQLVSNGHQPVNPFWPMESPVWKLMDGDDPVLSQSIAAYESSSWDGQGGPPWVGLVNYDDPGSFPNGAKFRIFSADTSSYYDVDQEFIDEPSKLFIHCIDAANSWFAPSESFGLSLAGARYGMLISEFPDEENALYASRLAGPYYNAPPQTGSVGLVITKVNMFYLFESQSTSRVGVILNAKSGSPQLSMEPTFYDPSPMYPGDVWFKTPRSGNPNLMMADTDASGTIYIGRIVASRVGESSSSLVARFAGTDAPSASVLGVNSLVVDDWLQTVNSATSVGSGWQNVTWGGGMYMPNSGAVSIWSRAGTAHNFLIPSGSMFVQQNLTLRSGSFTIVTGSLTLLSGSITMNSGNLIINDPSGTIFLSGSNTQLSLSGSNAAILLRGLTVISVMTGSADINSVTASNGTLYINTGSSAVWLRANNQWFDFNITAPLLVDGGFF